MLTTWADRASALADQSLPFGGGRGGACEERDGAASADGLPQGALGRRQRTRGLRRALPRLAPLLRLLLLLLLQRLRMLLCLMRLLRGRPRSQLRHLLAFPQVSHTSGVHGAALLTSPLVQLEACVCIGGMCVQPG